MPVGLVSEWIHSYIYMFTFTDEETSAREEGDDDGDGGDDDDAEDMARRKKRLKVGCRNVVMVGTRLPCCCCGETIACCCYGKTIWRKHSERNETKQTRHSLPST